MTDLVSPCTKLNLTFKALALSPQMLGTTADFICEIRRARISGQNKYVGVVRMLLKNVQRRTCDSAAISLE